MGRQAEGAKDAQLKGPITFPQERLLSYFWNLLKSEAADDTTAAWDERAAQQQQSAEVFMLLRSLVSLRLLSQASVIKITALLAFTLYCTLLSAILIEVQPDGAQLLASCKLLSILPAACFVASQLISLQLTQTEIVNINTSTH